MPPSVCDRCGQILSLSAMSAHDSDLSNDDKALRFPLKDIQRWTDDREKAFAHPGATGADITTGGPQNSNCGEDCFRIAMTGVTDQTAFSS